MKRLAITSIQRRGHQLAMAFDIDGYRFSTSYWYGDVDLDALAERVGAAVVDRLCFHIAAFEVNKLASLAPEVIDLGPYAVHHTEAFERLWRRVFEKVWAQWRYEHDRPGYAGPAFASSPRAADAGPMAATAGDVDVLSFCGGGKDSLVAAKLLERGGVPHASFAYASSIYGRAVPQHALIDDLLDQCAPARRHRMWSYDDFMDSPVAELVPAGVRSLAAAETPASVFAALPLVLAHGYRYLALAHEASANVGNLVWDATGEDVNHQWGKSLEAEALLDDYVRGELVAGVSYFSVLQPIHDALIFWLLRRDAGAVAHTHSCNVAKPWCWECPKCAYVWLGYLAYLPREVVAPLLARPVFDLPANAEHFRRMLGLAEHTPFECIGQIDEARLAFELCRLTGYTGAAIDAYARELGARDIDIDAIAAKYLAVNREQHRIPPAIADAVLPQMERAGADALEYIRSSVRTAS